MSHEKVRNFRKSMIIDPEDSYVVAHDTEIVNLTTCVLAMAIRSANRAVQLKGEVGKKSLNIIEIYDDPVQLDDEQDDEQKVVVQLEEGRNCLECDKRKVCNFFKNIRDAYNSMCAEIGNWKDHVETVTIVLGVTAVNCNLFRPELTDEQIRLQQEYTWREG